MFVTGGMTMRTIENYFLKQTSSSLKFWFNTSDPTFKNIYICIFLTVRGLYLTIIYLNYPKASTTPPKHAK